MTGEEFDKLTGIPSFCQDGAADAPDVSGAPGFTIDGVTEVVWCGDISDGVYAEGTWSAVVQTADGWFYVIDAWCDTTGWGCQDGTTVRGPFDAKRALHPVALDARCRRAAWEAWRAACLRFDIEDPGPLDELGDST